MKTKTNFIFYGKNKTFCNPVKYQAVEKKKTKAINQNYIKMPRELQLATYYNTTRLEALNLEGNENARK